MDRIKLNKLYKEDENKDGLKLTLGMIVRQLKDVGDKELSKNTIFKQIDVEYVDKEIDEIINDLKGLKKGVRGHSERMEKIYKGR